MNKKDHIRHCIAIGISLMINEINYNKAVELMEKALKKYHKHKLKKTYRTESLDTPVIIDIIGSVPKMKNPPPPPPRAPLSRVIANGTAGDCPKCHSTTVKRFYFFGRSIGCLQKECENYFKRFTT